MTFISAQNSKLVLAVATLLKFFLLHDAIETDNINNKQDATLADVIKALNEYRDFIDHDYEAKSDKVRNENIRDSPTNGNKTYLNVNGIEIARRSEDGESAWVCQSQLTWRDLGSLHYPRFIKEVQCLRSCMHGYYRCLPQNYTVRVLSSRQYGDGMEISLPRNLREEWKLTDIPISVGCVCGI